MKRDKKNSMINSQVEDNQSGMNIVPDEDNQKYVDPISKSYNRPGSEGSKAFLGVPNDNSQKTQLLGR